MENHALVPQFMPPPIGGYVENKNGYKYKIINVLTSGALGTIFLGYDMLEIPYAIKVFRPITTYEAVRAIFVSNTLSLE